MYQTLVLLVVVGFLVFLVFSIMRVAFNRPMKVTFNNPIQESMYDVPYTDNLASKNSVGVEESEVPQQAAPIRPNEEALPHPEVPGQTEEELKTPEPLQERVNHTIEAPSPMDPNQIDDNAAQFGSNLRHPEAMLVKSGSNFASLETEMAAGVAGRPAVEQLPLSVEMAQNGGEFMKGIFAFDLSDSGTTFSAY
jgi:hypothetical protein